MLKYSIIIIGRKQFEKSNLKEILRDINYPADLYEVITASGTSPSKQRNMAAAKATGDILLFLDDDSRPHLDLLHFYNKSFSYSQNIKVAGGPSCQEDHNNEFQKTLGYVFTSIFGVGPLRSRYYSRGKIRLSTEKELILCNLAVKRSCFNSYGQLNTNLYPNEENEFINRFKKSEIVYNPDAMVFRQLRSNINELIKQMIGYGSGRAKHFIISPRIKDFVYLIPSLFVFYMICFLIVFILRGPTLLAIPLLFYVSLNLIFSFHLARKHKIKMKLFTIFSQFFIIHFFYGVGIIWGFIKKKLQTKDQNKSNIQITLNKSLSNYL